MSYIYLYLYTYIYIYISVCVCVPSWSQLIYVKALTSCDDPSVCSASTSKERHPASARKFSEALMEED